MWRFLIKKCCFRRRFLLDSENSTGDDSSKRKYFLPSLFLIAGILAAGFLIPGVLHARLVPGEPLGDNDLYPFRWWLNRKLMSLLLPPSSSKPKDGLLNVWRLLIDVLPWTLNVDQKEWTEKVQVWEWPKGFYWREL